jgi:hypothetical protein
MERVFLDAVTAIEPDYKLLCGSTVHPVNRYRVSGVNNCHYTSAARHATYVQRLWGWLDQLPYPAKADTALANRGLCNASRKCDRKYRFRHTHTREAKLL